MVVYGFAALFTLIAAGSVSDGKNEGAIAAGAMVAVIFGSVITVPISALMTTFMVTGVHHLTLMIVGVKVRPFEASLRAVCFGLAPLFWGVVPFCGYYASLVWAAVCMIFGHKAVHRTTGGKAAAGVLLPAGLCCGSIAVLYGAVVAVALAGKH
jgi:hypothetical protein